MCEEPEDQEWRRATVRKHEKYFNLASSFVTCAENLEDEFAGKRITRERFGLDGLLISFLFAKSHKTALAALLLCKRGYPEDAVLLARANFEAALWAQYIAKDRENAPQKADAFFKHDVIERKKRLEKIVNLYEEGSASRERFERLLNDLETQLPRTEDEHKRICGLANKTLLDLAKEDRLTHVLYRTFYWESSEYAHSKARSANSYILDADGHVDVLVVPKDEGVANVIVHLCLSLWHLMDRFNFLFELGAEEMLDQRLSELGEICREKRPT